MSAAIILLIAVLGDFLWGDPGGKYHPVALIGSLISRMENLLYKDDSNPTAQFIRGTLAALGVLVIIGLATTLLTKVNFLYIDEIFQGILLSFAISVRTLILRGMEICDDLRLNDLFAARSKLSYIVSRETDQLEKADIIRGTVETMSENFVDGIVAPLFWFILFGLPGAVVYRTANTLDAMYGYRNERYEYFGKFAARLDDLLNYIPARIGGIILIMSGAILQYKPCQAIAVWFKDAKLHPSPNSGIPEAVAAGLLGVRLGGTNYYGGKPHFRAYLGKQDRPFTVHNITALRNLIYTATIIYTGILLVILAAVNLPLAF